MTLAATFFLRIFFYGLVAFVPEGDDAFVLLREAPHHTAFIMVEECVDPCPEFREGFPLQGYDIEVAPFTDTDSGPSPLLRDPVQGGELPMNQAEARSLAWVPELKSFLGNPQQAQLLKCYLEYPIPKDCFDAGRAKLAGRMHALSGNFKTCKLAQKENNDPVYSFQFKGYWGGPNRHEQALAEIVDLTLSTAITGDFATLVLKDFEGNEKYRIKVKPSSCLDGPPNADCVDIFIGNMPEKDPGNAYVIGSHFTHFYDLLKENKQTKFLPYRNILQNTAATIQPVCRRVPIPDSLAAALKKESHHGAKSALTHTATTAPESRSVCPMVVLDPP